MQTRDELIYEGVRDSFIETFGATIPFSADVCRQDHAHWDSLQHMIFLVSIEGRFGFKFDGATASKLNTVALIIQEVKSRQPI